MKNLNFEICMDILDWYDDDLYDFINHILTSKVDGSKRIQRALPHLQTHVQNLVEQNRNTARHTRKVCDSLLN